jgi:hypothetical protein
MGLVFGQFTNPNYAITTGSFTVKFTGTVIGTISTGLTITIPPGYMTGGSLTSTSN